MHRILLVHDRPEAQDIYAAVLEKENFTVFKASDAATAADLTLQHHPDAIVIDDGLPQMLGFDLTRILKSHPPLHSIAVIMLTALPRESRRAALRAGADGCVTKPFRRDTLVGEIQRVLKAA